MSITRNTDLPQHSLSGAHYGSLPLEGLPSGSTGDIFYNSGGNWLVTALSGVASTGTGSGTGTITVLDEGASQGTSVTSIDFVGSGVSASVSGSVATVTFSGAASSQSFDQRVIDLADAPAGGGARRQDGAIQYGGYMYWTYLRGDNNNVAVRAYVHATGAVTTESTVKTALDDDIAHAQPATPQSSLSFNLGAVSDYR